MLPIKVRSALALATLGASLLLTGAALAEEGFDKDPDDTIASKQQAKDEAAAGDKMPGEKDKKADEKESEVWNTYEDPMKPHRFIGARFRDVIVPRAIINLFADGGATVNVPMAGLEFGTRTNHLELQFALSYADYTKGDMLFKGKGEPDTAYERVVSDLRIVYGTIDVLYEVPMDSKGRLAILIGGGVGIGGVFGNLYRRQVYPGQSGADPGDPKQWSDCAGVGSPNNGYCDNANNHFGNYSEASWANGGSKPFIFPWIAVPQVSLRYKPIKYVQTRLDIGFALTSGFYFGFAADYML
jgi:hypothetical protein